MSLEKPCLCPQTQPMIPDTAGVLRQPVPTPDSLHPLQMPAPWRQPVPTLHCPQTACAHGETAWVSGVSFLFPAWRQLALPSYEPWGDRRPPQSRIYACSPPTASTKPSSHQTPPNTQGQTLFLPGNVLHFLSSRLQMPRLYISVFLIFSERHSHTPSFPKSWLFYPWTWQRAVPYLSDTTGHGLYLYQGDILYPWRTG